MTSEEYKEQLSEALGKLAGVHAVGDSWITFDGSIPAGGVPFTGQLVTRAMYADLWAWVQANKTVVTDSEWQTTANAQNGMNAAYSSGDGSTTFRLPCAVGGYLCAGDTSTAGQYVKEGLPYFGGSIQGVVTDEGYGTGIFSFQQTKLENLSIVASGAKAAGTFTLSPPSVYGNSQHVTPETFKVMVGVYAFGVVGPVGEATAEGILAELNRKVDIDVGGKGVVRTVDGVAADEEGGLSIIHSAGPGWVRFAYNLQICWGRTTFSAGASTAKASFGAAFATTDYAISCTQISTTASGRTFSIYNKYTTYANLARSETSSSGVFDWVAIGRWQ